MPALALSRPRLRLEQFVTGLTLRAFTRDTEADREALRREIERTAERLRREIESTKRRLGR